MMVMVMMDFGGACTQSHTGYPTQNIASGLVSDNTAPLTAIITQEINVLIMEVLVLVLIIVVVILILLLPITIPLP